MFFTLEDNHHFLQPTTGSDESAPYFGAEAASRVHCDPGILVAMALGQLSMPKSIASVECLYSMTHTKEHG